MNSTNGGAKYTNRKQAERLVGRGVARWAGRDGIKFIEADYRWAPASASPAPFTDGDHYPTLEALYHYPVIRAPKLLTGKRGPYPKPDERIEISRTPGVLAY